MGCNQSKPSDGKSVKRQKSKSFKNGKRQNMDEPSQHQILSPSENVGINNEQKIQHFTSENLPAERGLINHPNLPEQKHVIQQENLPEERQLVMDHQRTIYGNAPEEKQVINQQKSISEKFPVGTTSQFHPITEYVVENNEVEEPAHYNTGSPPQIPEAYHDPATEYTVPVNAWGSPERSENILRQTDMSVDRDSKSEHYCNTPSPHRQKGVNSAEKLWVTYEVVSPPRREVELANNYDNSSTQINSDYKGLSYGNDPPAQNDSSPLHREPEQISNYVNPVQVSHPNAKSKVSTNYELQRQRVESYDGVGSTARITNKNSADSTKESPYKSQKNDPSDRNDKTPFRTEPGQISNEVNPEQETDSTVKSNVSTNYELERQTVESNKGTDSSVSIHSNKGVVSTKEISHKTKITANQKQLENHNDPYGSWLSKNSADSTTGIQYETNISVLQEQPTKHNDSNASREEPDANVSRFEESNYLTQDTGNICMDARTGEYKFYQNGVLIGSVEKDEAEKISKNWPICYGADTIPQNDWRFQRHASSDLRDYVNLEMSGYQEVNGSQHMDQSIAWSNDESYLNQPYSEYAVSQPMFGHRGQYI